MKFIYTTLCFLLLLSFTSCKSYYYLPTKQNVMVFKKKGDAILAMNTSCYNGAGIEAGYAITDNIGLYSSLNTFDITNRTGGKGFGNDYIWDNEVMYFKKYNSLIYTGMNVGVGFGQLNQNNPYYQMGLYRQFIQPSIGITKWNFIELAYSLRFTHLSYSIKPLMSLESDYDKTMFNQYFTFQDLAHSNFYFFEPAMTMGFNFNILKLQLQWSGAIKTKPEADFYLFSNLNASVSFNLTKLFVKKK